MRQATCAAALLLAALSARAADSAPTNAPALETNTTASATVTNHLNITTLNGETYERCKIRRVDPDGLYIFHSRGIAKISFRELPDDLRRKYDYDPVEANQYSTEQAAARRAAAYRSAQRQAAERKQQEEKQQRESLARRRRYSVPEFPRSNPLPRSLGKTDRNSLQEFNDWHEAEMLSIDRELERQDRELEELYREGVIDWRP